MPDYLQRAARQVRPVRSILSEDATARVPPVSPFEQDLKARKALAMLLQKCLQYREGSSADLVGNLDGVSLRALGRYWITMRKEHAYLAADVPGFHKQVN